MEFNVEEMALLAAFDTGDRAETIAEMQEMKNLLESTISRLNRMTDEEYRELEIIEEEDSDDDSEYV